jgi:cytochrome c oxidase subunit IV
MHPTAVHIFDLVWGGLNLVISVIWYLVVFPMINKFIAYIAIMYFIILEA